MKGKRSSRRHRRSMVGGEGHDSDDSGADSDIDTSDDGADAYSVSSGEGALDHPSYRRKHAARSSRGKPGSRRSHGGQGHWTRRTDGIDYGDALSDDDSHMGVTPSRKIPDPCVTDSMSVTSSSSVAVGSVMGRSLGTVMASSFADDGLVWGAATDDAFFHENVTPPMSPLLSSSIAARSPSMEMGFVSRRTNLF